MQTRPAFTLLIAVLIASVLLALGFAIYNVISKEIVLSSSGRESQFAFYAADTGAECALYWDTVHDAFSNSSEANGISSVFCGEEDALLTRNPIGGPTDLLETTFTFSLGTELSDPCVSVGILRSHNPTTTKIESLGYNTCVTTNPRRIERAIRVQY